MLNTSDSGRNKITDKGISNLVYLTDLRACYTLITDRAICNLINLTKLDIRSSYHMADGVVSTLTNLEHLFLDNETYRITDKGISGLNKLLNFKSNLRYNQSRA